MGLKECLDGSMSAAWDYTGFLSNDYQVVKAATILKPLVLNPHSTTSTHGATSC